MAHRRRLAALQAPTTGFGLDLAHLSTDAIKIRSTRDRGEFALLFSSETILVKIGNEPKQQIYHLHIDKLKKSSEYFNRLFSFNGKEIEQNEIILGEDFEGLGLAFDAFVEWIYTGQYHIHPPDSLAEDFAILDANLIILAERLVSESLKILAIENLEGRLLPAFPPKPISADAMNEIVKIVYEGTHRPYGEVDVADSESSRRLKEANERRGLFRQTPPPSEPKGTDVSYRNCKARKVVSKHVAKHLDVYRRNPDFRGLVADYGEFAMDLIMEEIRIGESDQVVVSY